MDSPFLPAGENRLQEPATPIALGLTTGGALDAQQAPEAAQSGGADAGEATPREAGLLTDVLAVDAAQLQTAVTSFLDQLEQVGTSLASSPGGLNLYCWLLAAAAAAAACVIVHRQGTPQRNALPLGAGDGFYPSTLQVPGGPMEKT